MHKPVKRNLTMSQALMVRMGLGGYDSTFLQGTEGETISEYSDPDGAPPARAFRRSSRALDGDV